MSGYRVGLRLPYRNSGHCRGNSPWRTIPSGIVIDQALHIGMAAAIDAAETAGGAATAQGGQDGSPKTQLPKAPSTRFPYFGRTQSSQDSADDIARTASCPLATSAGS